MIITFTANPSLDRTVTLTTPLSVGGVHRIDRDATQPGGKGINVALAVKRAGLPALAVLPAGPGDELLPFLEEDGLDYLAVPVTAPVRTNITVVAGGETTKINEPGGELSAEEVKRIEDALVAAAGPGDTVMLSGSLAPGFPPAEYARLTRVLRERHEDVWVGVDTSDAPLAALAATIEAGEGGAAPNFLKPNAEELGQLTGRDGVALERQAEAGDLTSVRQAALQLNQDGVGEVLVTLGGAGAVLAVDGEAWFSPAPQVDVASTVGAGDSATAGYLIARSNGLPPAERLALAVAYGATAASLPGTTIPNRDQVRADPSVVRRI